MTYITPGGKSPSAGFKLLTRFALAVCLSSMLSCTMNSVIDVSGPKEQVWQPVSPVPKLPIGMNLNQHNYYGTSLPFTDVMTTASEMLTTNSVTNPWDSAKISEIQRDGNGYPTYLPQTTSDGFPSHVRFLVNNYYLGKYRILYDGQGTFGANVFLENGKYYINLNGTGENRFIDILTSEVGNPVKNIRIVPQAYENSKTIPTFQPKYLEGLQTFHALRFMDWINTNGSTQKNWIDRVTKAYYSQGGKNGISFEYAIELCNTLDADPWVCVPHMASDDYIRQMARLWRDNLEAGRIIYLEYSNEIWNWMFSQSHYVLENAPGAVDTYVSTDLGAINPAQADHPEKDAYMMARVFRLWSEEFGSAASTRLVKVATGQHAWADNSRRILKYLFEKTAVKCDALAVGGYFNFTEETHKKWLANPAYATAGLICDDTLPSLSLSDQWTRESAAYAAQYGVKYLVYEGGQHMQPWLQGEFNYNNNLYEAQIHPKMYQMYLKNFTTEVEPAVNCQLFMAFNYVGERKSHWGSWGHLESLDMIGTDYAVTAPKFKALLDCNTTK